MNNNASGAAPWNTFISDWKALPLTTELSEQAIREEILAPMLAMLGYGLRTIGTILYEHIQPLPDEYRMIGAKRIRVDYIPTLKLAKFWVMEAKKPGTLSDSEGNREAFLQAHFYATYPTINARYIVLADGEQIRVYDARATSLEEARLIVNRGTAETNFADLYGLLAARNILDAIRRDILADVERVLSKEIDIEAPRCFANALSEITQRVTPIIRENVRQLIVTHYQTKRDAREEYLRNADVRTILAILSHPTEVGLDTSTELSRRLIESEDETRRAIASQLALAVAQPVRQTVRIGVMRAFLLAGASRKPTEWRQLMSLGETLARENLSYASHNPLLNAAFHFENAADRVAMKWAQHSFQHAAIEAEQSALATMALEDVLTEPPSKNRPLIMTASGITVKLAKQLHTPDPALLLRRVRALERFEQKYLPEPPAHLPGDHVLLGYKGVTFDFLIRATVDVLYQVLRRTPDILSTDLAAVAAGWETHIFPATPPVPAGDVDEQTFLDLEATFLAE